MCGVLQICVIRGMSSLGRVEDCDESATSGDKFPGSVEQGLVWVPEGWDYEVIIGAVVSIAH